MTRTRPDVQGTAPSHSRTRTALLGFLAAAMLFFAGVSVLAYRERPQGLIASDGKSYYAWLRSIALDGDIDFANDFSLIFPPDPVPAAPITPSGRIANKVSVGVAIVEIPGFVAGHAIARITPHSENGVSAPYQFAVTLWLQLLLLAGLWAFWVALVRLGADDVIAAVMVASALTATNLLQYAARPAMSHAPGLAVLCLTIYVLVGIRGQGSPRMSRVALVGFLLGLAAIIRTSNMALAPFFLAILAPRIGRSRQGWAILLAAALSVISIQVALTSALWGGLRFVGYEGEGFTSGARGVFNALFSARHGLFVYHPWYLLALGLTLAAIRVRQLRTIAPAAVASFLLFAFFNGTWWSWWFGDGFGNRSFIEIIPALVVPATLWLSRHADKLRTVRWTAASTAIVLSILNATLWVGYVLRRYPPDGRHSVAEAYLWFWR